MRTQDAIDAWREVLELDAATSARWRRWRSCSCRRRAGRRRVDILERRAEALANPTEQVDVLMQAASLWADKIGDGGSAGAGLRARAADRSGEPDRLASSWSSSTASARAG